MSAMKPALNLGCLDLWLRSVKDLYEREKHVLDKLQTIEEKGDLLCELNVANSVCNIGKSYILQRAWGKGQQISIHGWCYRITDGILKDLGINVTGIHDLDRIAIRS